MEYTSTMIEQYAGQPLEFAQWMSQNGFISIQGRTCLDCGSKMELQCALSYSSITYLSVIYAHHLSQS